MTKTRSKWLTATYLYSMPDQWELLQVLLPELFTSPGKNRKRRGTKRTCKAKTNPKPKERRKPQKPRYLGPDIPGKRLRLTKEIVRRAIKTAISEGGPNFQRAAVLANYSSNGSLWLQLIYSEHSRGIPASFFQPQNPRHLAVGFWGEDGTLYGPAWVDIDEEVLVA